MNEKWAIENDTGAELTVRAPIGFAVELDANSPNPRVRFAYFAIRQQVRDLEQLRTDLAAAVAITAARDETIAELESRLRISRQSNKELREAVEQAEARLSAIDAAPTVAIAVHVYTDRGPYKYLNFAEHDIPASGVELIARPAKD